MSLVPATSGTTESPGNTPAAAVTHAAWARRRPGPPPPRTARATRWPCRCTPPGLCPRRPARAGSASGVCVARRREPGQRRAAGDVSEGQAPRGGQQAAGLNVVERMERRVADLVDDAQRGALRRLVPRAALVPTTAGGP